MSNGLNAMLLRFPEDQIPRFAKQYSYSRGEQPLLDMSEDVLEAGYLSKVQLKELALWKAPRAAGHIEKNDPAFVQEITSFALAADSERARIQTLTTMDGVQWPTASVILHLFHKDPYPILDFRALWSVGLEVPDAYTFEFWWPYVEFCRTLANRNSVDMRTLDRALWQFSKENQDTEQRAVSSIKSGSRADAIRGFVANTVIQPELASGTKQIRVRAGDIHKAMQLKQRFPAVCSALESKKLADICGVEIVHREGPRQGANAVFIFRLREEESARTQAPKREPQKEPVRRPRSRPSSSNGNTNTVYWLSCVSQKRTAPAAAKDLYISDLFSKARSYIESTGAPWFILSAKYGLISPESVIAPYDLTLNKMAIADRRQWADRVLDQLDKQGLDPQRIVMLAGARYREFLTPALKTMGVEVYVPMEGLRIGEQLRWLGEQVQRG